MVEGRIIEITEQGGPEVMQVRSSDFPDPEEGEEKVESRDEGDHRDSKHDDQAPAAAPCILLVGKKVHRHGLSVPTGKPATCWTA